jgi:2-keto-4-pentenoate hydratase/2-oxohepta-3-ene-1,7-dioic acid hydratase in catechol pathway
MKLSTYLYNNIQSVGVLNTDETHLYPLSSNGLAFTSMLELIKSYNKAVVADLSSLAEKPAAKVKDAAPVEAVHLLAPIPSAERDVICLGKNYFEHAKESARFKGEDFDPDKATKDKPIYFSKNGSKMIGNNDPIPAHSDITDSVDYECELGVIIGKSAARLKPDEVREHIFGYTIINDVSARNLQLEHKQWYFAKSLDGFCPSGPYIITADSVSYPPSLNISSKINGELRQNSNTSKLIHSIDEVVCELSAGTTLEAGTIIATGTPDGVGMGFNPPKFLKHGDKVECIIEAIGTLTNTID